jgi:hypothetical protein
LLLARRPQPDATDAFGFGAAFGAGQQPIASRAVFGQLPPRTYPERSHDWARATGSKLAGTQLPRNSNSMLVDAAARIINVSNEQGQAPHKTSRREAANPTGSTRERRHSTCFDGQRGQAAVRLLPGIELCRQRAPSPCPGACVGANRLRGGRASARSRCADGGAKAGMVAGMSRNGDCWDNAVAERIFGMAAA